MRNAGKKVCRACKQRCTHESARDAHNFPDLPGMLTADTLALRPALSETSVSALFAP